MGDEVLPAPAASGTLNVKILRSSADSQVAKDDRVAVEAPLEFLLHHPALGPEPMSFGTTMRTPGDDESLAAGLLYGEGIVNRAADIDALESAPGGQMSSMCACIPRSRSCRTPPPAYFRLVRAAECAAPTGLDAPSPAPPRPTFPTPAMSLCRCCCACRPNAHGAIEVRGHRRVHASALFDFSGTLLNIAEDVGRHNAFDKLVGMSLMSGDLPLANRIVVLSGRASFELVQRQSARV